MSLVNIKGKHQIKRWKAVSPGEEWTGIQGDGNWGFQNKAFRNIWLFKKYLFILEMEGAAES